MRHVWTLLIATHIVAFGCVEDAAAPSARPLSVGLDDTSGSQNGGSETPPTTFTDDAGTVYAMTEIRAILRHIELDLPSGVTCAEVEDELVGAICEVDKIVVEGPFVVDLLQGTSTPSLSNVRVPDLAYPRADLRIDDADSDTGLDPDDPLNDYSWILRATFTRDDDTLELYIRLKLNEDIRFEAPEGVRASSEAPLLVVFDPAVWLNGIPIEACLDAGDIETRSGTLEISDNSATGQCSDIETLLKANLKESGQLR